MTDFAQDFGPDDDWDAVLRQFFPQDYQDEEADSGGRPPSRKGVMPNGGRTAVAATLPSFPKPDRTESSAVLEQLKSQINRFHMPFEEMNRGGNIKAAQLEALFQHTRAREDADFAERLAEYNAANPKWQRLNEAQLYSQTGEVKGSPWGGPTVLGKMLGGEYDLAGRALSNRGRTEAAQVTARSREAAAKTSAAARTTAATTSANARVTAASLRGAGTAPGKLTDAQRAELTSLKAEIASADKVLGSAKVLSGEISQDDPVVLQAMRRKHLAVKRAKEIIAGAQPGAAPQSGVSRSGAKWTLVAPAPTPGGGSRFVDEDSDLTDEDDEED